MMELKEYMDIKRRMVKLNPVTGCGASCYDCPLGLESIDGCSIECMIFEMRHPEKAEKIVKQWAKEHPAKTYAQDFYELHPNAPKDNYGTPAACRKYIYGAKDDYDCKTRHCEACWNEPMEEEA